MILAVTSSGRKSSNSTALLEAALGGLPPNFPVSRRSLAEIAFHGCLGCGSCRNGSPGCVMNDGLTPLLEEMKDARGLLIAGPIYYGYLSGILKSFLDRWYGFRDRERNLRLQAGRPLLCILTQGHPDATAYGTTFDSLDRIFKGYGFEPHRLVAAGVEGPGAVHARPEVMEEAAILGGKLAGKAGLINS